MTKALRILSWLILAVLFIWIAISNRTPVMIGFAWTPWLLELTVYQVFFIGIFLGMVIAGIAGGWFRLKSFTKRRQAERRAEALSKDVETLAEDAHKAQSENAQRTASDSSKELEHSQK